MAETCINKVDNEKNCPCTHVDCSNHGICCKCIASHRAKGNFPACMRTLAK